MTAERIRVPRCDVFHDAPGKDDSFFSVVVIRSRRLIRLLPPSSVIMKARRSVLRSSLRKLKSKADRSKKVCGINCAKCGKTGSKRRGKAGKAMDAANDVGCCTKTYDYLGCPDSFGLLLGILLLILAITLLAKRPRAYFEPQKNKGASVRFDLEFRSVDHSDPAAQSGVVLTAAHSSLLVPVLSAD